MKKVLFAASVYSHFASFHKPFMKMFQQKGYEVHAVGSNSRKRKDELLDIGVICHDVDFDRMPFSKKNMRAVKELNDLFRQHYFNLIHVHTPTAAFLTRYAASKHNQGKILYTAHGFHFFNGASRKNWLLFYPAEKLAKRWTDGLLVMNEEDISLGKRLGFMENHNMFHVHGVGVNLKEFNEKPGELIDIKNELGLTSENVIISCIAELSPRKNQLFLLKNWNSIVDQCPNAHLLIIGYGEDMEKIKAFIEENWIMNVHLLGYRKDIPSIIAASDIVTLVSKHEGLPRCLMEAMAAAKPIITTNVRGSRDLVDNGHCGLVVGLGDNEGLIQSFVRLIEDKQLRINFGRLGQQKIQAYSLGNVLNEMEEIYSRYV
ncbi:glycosyltransferase family 4 protein [Paenibacillus sp. BSR1-1]|uniref:glycosyltransferase family 4 protein n=1 Tax=Paenibacillus sp. BSR1-1 TaxID=3020845 RepID=UPI0025B093C0|nr:glycosyltransferase family 4 protein [Paenibacillus sp. BSR1-1]MDN3019272.1 glycosyltransferase family 4 protein [Paenibacillus sp. BSR1-1]